PSSPLSLPLHDALPIFIARRSAVPRLPRLSHTQFLCLFAGAINADPRRNADVTVIPAIAGPGVSPSMPCSESGHPLGVCADYRRSEEHTSELQSRVDLV